MIPNRTTTTFTPYSPPWGLRNGHLSTIYPALFRRVNTTKPYIRKRIKTRDGDFLDLDLLTKNSSRVVIISHGLEGNSTRPYVLGVARACFAKGIDVIAWNCRGCSEEVNLKPRLYHSGATDDLWEVVQFASALYQEIHLVGFSLGGNLTLKFVGENDFPHSLKSAVAFSVPIDLHAGAKNISNPKNILYEKRFLKSLRNKIKAKHAQFPELPKFGLDKFARIKTLMDFDEHYTAPIHGFDSAIDYYQQNSAKFFLGQINIPTMVVNAINDPLLPPECLDHSLFDGNANLTFMTPRFGGHCGFPGIIDDIGSYWSEELVVSFILSQSVKE
ncbi:MAG: alpha/beta fold hydrolase [Cyclobacteriaceae bacterium]|nr:alpha/beta fold hydrolase [Cyclobacteriaceae bacterium HetDA_MAG_MS6]